MTGGAGYGRMRKWRLLLLLDCFVIAVEACEDEERDEEVQKRVYLDAAEGVDCCSRLPPSMDSCQLQGMFAILLILLRILHLK